MKKVFWTGILAGFVILVSDFVAGALFKFVFPALSGQYMTGTFRPWSDPKMMLYFLYPFIIGIMLSYAWSKMKTLFISPSALMRGKYFGLFAWVFLCLPGMFVTYTSFTVSAVMVLSWTVSGLVGLVLSGELLARMNP